MDPSSYAWLTIHLPHSRQATLYTACYRNTGLIPSSGFINHQFGPPRKLGHRPHAIADRPSSLTPSTSPQLGVGSQHQELHRYALNGFLAPPSKMAELTRILYHQNINYIIKHIYTQCLIIHRKTSYCFHYTAYIGYWLNFNTIYSMNRLQNNTSVEDSVATK